MSIQEFISHTRETLLSTFAEIDTWFSREESLGKYRPKDGGWSVDQVLEHIGLTNHYLLILIEKGTRKALEKAAVSTNNGNGPYHPDLERLGLIGQHRSFVWIRPEHMEPKGEKTLDAVRQQLKDQVNQCLSALDRLPNGEGTLSKTTMTVNGLGKIDVYQYIFFLAQHARRHITQMQRVEQEYREA